MFPYLVIAGLLIYIFRNKIKTVIISRFKDLVIEKKNKIFDNENSEEDQIDSEKMQRIRSVAMYFACVFLVPIGLCCAIPTSSWGYFIISGIGLLGIGFKLIYKGTKEYIDLSSRGCDLHEETVGCWIGGAACSIVGLIFITLSCTL